MSQSSRGQNVYVDLRDLHPAHSLSEFAPRTEKYANLERYPYRLDYLKELKKILMRNKGEAPEEQLRHFLQTDVVLFRDGAQRLVILQLSSGKQVVLYGHHRVAALITAVRRNVIPESWLHRVPALLYKLPPNFPIPEAIILHALAPANELTVNDLLLPME